MQPLGFLAIMAGAVLLVAGVSGSTIPSVAKGAPDKSKAAGPEVPAEAGGGTALAAGAGAPSSNAPAAGTTIPKSSGKGGFSGSSSANYSRVKPELVARLSALGAHLGLSLEGISGYRTPQHSVEVGGFADDPHTRGEASDTEGTQSIAKSVLNAFGLERPFPGSAEANHIQLLHSVTTFGGY
jgi:hypothetical protein